MSLATTLARWAKHADTALVRQMRAGNLSPETISRAAGGMEPGRFRFLNPLGRGQFSLVDKVVGNVGGYAGEMARKLPTQQVPIEAEAGKTKTLIDYINQHYGTPGKDPPLTPYVDVNSQGAFQRMADGAPGPLPAALRRFVGDLHPGNLGPNGQVMDFSLNARHSPPGLPATPTPIRTQLRAPRIDPSAALPGGADMLGNIAPGDKSWLQSALDRSNNIIRRYWSLPESGQRANFAQQVRQGQGPLTPLHLDELAKRRQGLLPTISQHLPSNWSDTLHGVGTAGGLGGLIGAARAPTGQMSLGAVRGAVRGGALQGGFNAGGAAGHALGLLAAKGLHLPLGRGADIGTLAGSTLGSVGSWLGSGKLLDRFLPYAAAATGAKA